MKNRFSFLLLASVVLFSAQPQWAKGRAKTKAKPAPKSATIRVAVFKGLGGDAECISDAFEALKIDPAIEPQILRAADLLVPGTLDKLDAIVLPGGGGARQMGNLGQLGQEKLLEFVRQGKGMVGLCAGAYMLSDTPDYACFHLGGFEAIDRDHDERGNGMVHITFTPAGLDVFPECKDVKAPHMHYFEGPVFVKAKNTVGTEVATMQSDVHLKNDAPANMTNGKPFLAWADAGKGRVFLSSGHPENTPGMRWLVPRMVRWTLRQPLVAYDPAVVRPKRNDKEFLFDTTLKAKEKACFTLLMPENTDGAKKCTAIADLLAMRSWGTKERLEGCMRDTDPKVRVAAAEALVDLEHTAATTDVQRAAQREKDPQTRLKLEQCAKALSAMSHGR